MEKKNCLKDERACVAPVTDQPLAASWAGSLVNCLGIVFILTSLVQLGALSDFSKFRYLFQDYSAGYVLFRYIVSCGVGLLGLAVGFGLCFRKERFRKAALFLSWGTIAAAYWKHPFLIYWRSLRLLNEQMKAQGQALSPESVIQYVQTWSMPWFTESAFAWIYVAIIILTEFFIALAVIFILTRPSVKPVFQ